MATYFNGNSEILGNGDGLQTLIFMNPAYVNGFSDRQQQIVPSNAAFLNSNTFPDAPPQTQHFAHYNIYNLPPVELEEAAHHRLSLSLSSQQQHLGFRREHDPVHSTVSVGDDGRGSYASDAAAVQRVLLSSKYLKAAQDLLDEVANVGIGKRTTESDKSNREPSAAAGDSSANRGSAEIQEIQMKKAKLINMLDEVEHRYRQYHNQMKMVISWFEQAGGGIGCAKSYTALALQTISKQFRCLKDSIFRQIKAASKSLGEEEEEEEGGKIESWRLKYVDNQIRQQKALQQLGMIKQNAWRPQRGLPETSVSVLRSWLFEHFLHPYPKDSDKIKLAKQTGLTRNQVSNWFINARVRLWKPMIEEMYMEEVKEQDTSVSEDKQHIESEQKSAEAEKHKKNITSKQVFSLIRASEMASSTQERSTIPLTNIKPKFDTPYPINGDLRFKVEQYQAPFPGSAGVSLTLGLQHRDNLSMSGANQIFMPNQIEREIKENGFSGMNTPTSAHSTSVYHHINFQNRSTFTSQLLHSL